MKRLVILLLVIFLVACQKENVVIENEDTNLGDINREVLQEDEILTQDEIPTEEANLTENITIDKAISYYVTTDEDNMFVKSDDLWASPEKEDIMAVEIAIDTNITYQTIDGFGASFTDSAAYLINQKLDEETRESLMQNLFDPVDGIGLSFLRQPMGASDFARTMYSYNDLAEGEEDFELEHFSIDHDREDIIPLLKRAKELNPNVLLMASPWTPPAWMKTTSSLIGGELRKDCYDVYGDYFIRYLQAYEEEGLPIYAISPQNEPLYVPSHYPGNGMTALAQAQFINESLGPKLQEFGFDTKLLCYDHNWDVTDYPELVLEKASEYVDGVAWHVYGGDPSSQSKVLDQFPDTEVYFTEASGGEWVPPFEQAFMSTVVTGIEVLNNHSRSIVLWNMALDEENGPVVPGFGQSTCRGVIKVNQQTGELTYNLDYYALAHFSKFIQQGATRVSAESKGSIYTTACLNEDGTLVVVVANDGGKKPVRLLLGNQYIDFEMEGKSASTLVISL